jgi:hypothetical protein
MRASGARLGEITERCCDYGSLEGIEGLKSHDVRRAALSQRPIICLMEFNSVPTVRLIAASASRN